MNLDGFHGRSWAKEKRPRSGRTIISSSVRKDSKDYLFNVVLSASRRVRSAPFLQFDLRNCPLAADCLDGVTALNVLEHIDDDFKALQEIHRILRRGGLAHIEVPADPSSFDF
jgi:SAM-dependent methyltransferase